MAHLLNLFKVSKSRSCEGKYCQNKEKLEPWIYRRKEKAQEELKNKKTLGCSNILLKYVL